MIVLNNQERVILHTFADHKYFYIVYEVSAVAV